MTISSQGTELFMTEIQVADWSRIKSWYAETLGLRVVVDDPADQFALLAAGPARLALKGGGIPSGSGRGLIRLVFLVEDVAAERARLVALGEDVGPTADNAREGYREVRLHDPEGTPITLFCWLARSPITAAGAPGRSDQWRL